MSEIRNQVLEGRQLIDGVTYIDCEFKNAQLVFKGVQLPGFNNCKFTKSRFVFEENAATTVSLIRGMLQSQTGMRSFMTGMIPEIGA